MTPVIKTRGLSKRYGRSPAIIDLNLEILEGEIFGFLGPNGAGKSTTIRMILGLLRPSSGTITLFGQQKDSPERFRRIGNLPGELPLYEEMTGAAFLTYMSRLSGRPDRLRSRLVSDFGLSDSDLSKKIRGYSQGMKQKLGIIQAMQGDPDLLIMDEPSKGLDPISKNQLYDYLRQFQERGKTVFFSSHDLAEVEKVCHRVGLVKDGCLVAQDFVSRLKQKIVRRMRLEFDQPVPDKAFAMDHIQVLEQAGPRLVLGVSGDINPLIKQISRFRVKQMVFAEPALEDIFMVYYQRQ